MVKKSQIFVKRPHYIYLEGHIFHCFSTTSSIKEFVVTVQIFVYKFLFTIMFLGKRKKKLTKPFTFWKWKHISKKNQLLHNLTCANLSQNQKCHVTICIRDISERLKNIKEIASCLQFILLLTLQKTRTTRIICDRSSPALFILNSLGKTQNYNRSLTKTKTINITDKKTRKK